MAKPLAPQVRSQFAKRLKEMRVQAGFVRARHFANALGIEENRYTRYERAEVEPNLTLIHKMCDALHVSPNELLGFAHTEGLALSGFFEHSPRQEGASARSKSPLLDGLTWRLAEEIVAVRGRLRPAGNGTDDPLAKMRETAKLFQKMQRDPFGTVAEIAADERLQRLNSEHRSELADLIRAYTDGVSQNQQGDQPPPSDANRA